MSELEHRAIQARTLPTDSLGTVRQHQDIHSLPPLQNVCAPLCSWIPFTRDLYEDTECCPSASDMVTTHACRTGCVEKVPVSPPHALDKCGIEVASHNVGHRHHRRKSAIRRAVQQNTLFDRKAESPSTTGACGQVAFPLAFHTGVLRVDSFLSMAMWSIGQSFSFLKTTRVPATSTTSESSRACGFFRRW